MRFHIMEDHSQPQSRPRDELSDAAVAKVFAKMHRTLQEFDAQLHDAERVLAMLRTAHDGPGQDSGEDPPREESQDLAPPMDPPALSAGGFKVLALLKKGHAFQVRGHWRFRGFRGCIREPAMLSLLDQGFAERSEAQPYAQVRITEAGRSAKRVPKFAGAALESRGIAGSVAERGRHDGAELSH